jgi:hydroxyacylglutathione hydrolase
MNVKQFRYSEDNLGYLVYDKKKALGIDCGAVDAMLSFIQANQLELVYVTNTHTHADHTLGNRKIIEKTGATYIDTGMLYNRKQIDIENNALNVLHTPGHTLDSFCFLTGNILISGDTLFNGKAGRCFSGDMRGFLKSIKTIMTLPEHTVIYGGHDYVEEYMNVAKQIEPDNTDIDLYLKKYNPDHVCSTLGDELKVNPSLRFNDSKIISVLKQKNLPVKTEFDRWCSIMQIV